MEGEPCVVVVSGLPRSGTSLLMQMLQAGGIRPMTDEKRLADTHNPKGYLELERVKYLAADNTWLGAAKGRAIKIIVPLVPFLPTGIPYKILFMQRELGEILKSQERMLADQGFGALKTDELAPALEKMFSTAIAFANRHPQTQYEVIQYRDLVSSPMESSQRIKDFLESPDLDLESMVSAVDLSLYRNRF